MSFRPSVRVKLILPEPPCFQGFRPGKGKDCYCYFLNNSNLFGDFFGGGSHGGA